MRPGVPGQHVVAAAAVERLTAVVAVMISSPLVPVSVVALVALFTMVAWPSLLTAMPSAAP
jgi:hypothetical protein